MSIGELIGAIQNNNLNSVREILEVEGAMDQLEQDQFLYHPLQVATLGGHFEIVKELLRSGCSVEQTSKMLPTPPVVLAASCMYIDILSLLLEHNADTESQDMFGRTAMYFAVQGDCIAMAKTLAAYGANLDSKNPFNGQDLVDSAKLSMRRAVQVGAKIYKTHFASSDDPQKRIKISALLKEEEKQRQTSLQQSEQQIITDNINSSDFDKNSSFASSLWKLLSKSSQHAKKTIPLQGKNQLQMDFEFQTDSNPQIYNQTLQLNQHSPTHLNQQQQRRKNSLFGSFTRKNSKNQQPPQQVPILPPIINNQDQDEYINNNNIGVDFQNQKNNTNFVKKKIAFGKNRCDSAKEGGRDQNAGILGDKLVGSVGPYNEFGISSSCDSYQQLYDVVVQCRRNGLQNSEIQDIIERILQKVDGIQT